MRARPVPMLCLDRPRKGKEAALLALLRELSALVGRG